MLLTEKEAEEKWCPMYWMVCVPEGTLWDNRANNQGYSRCEASGCMAWRWADKPEGKPIYAAMKPGADVIGHEPRRGFCGLAGKVENP